MLRVYLNLQCFVHYLLSHLGQPLRGASVLVTKDLSSNSAAVHVRCPVGVDYFCSTYYVAHVVSRVRSVRVQVGADSEQPLATADKELYTRPRTRTRTRTDYPQFLPLNIAFVFRFETTPLDER